MTERNMQSESPDPTSLDVPIWVNGVQRWVTGLTKRTTCDDIIYALLYHDNKHEAHTTDNYAIFERWREVERPLQARTKLLKVWKAWGAEQCNVQLDMRKLDDYFLPGELSRSKRRHRKSKHRTRHASRSNGTSRCCGHESCYDTGQMRCLEGVVKLVITQERKLHDIKERIEETELMIENLETKRHFSRIHENGEDYVQNSYLDSASDDSSMDAFLSNIREDELDEYLEFCDRILELEDRIQRERNKIYMLTAKIQEFGAADGVGDCRTSDRGGLGRVVADVDVCEESEKCEQIQVDINRLVTANMMQRYKEEGIKRELQYFDQQIGVKQQILKSLKMELESLETPSPSFEESRSVGHHIRDLDFDGEDRVGQLHVHDQYPRMRTKSVTFDDTLNHMHVIGTSKENLTENIQNSQNHVARFQNSIPLKPRPPEFDKNGLNQGSRTEPRVTSILKNREILTQKQTLIDKPCINGDSYRDYRQPDDNHYKTDLPFNVNGSRNVFLPPAMYTYANDGHYSILERTCKPSRDDNDSDTGLSSMHSDESPGLETLV